MTEVPFSTLLQNRLHSGLSYAFIEVKKHGDGAVLYHYNGENSAEVNRNLLDRIVGDRASMLVSAPVTAVVDLSEQGLDTLGLAVDEHVRMS